LCFGDLAIAPVVASSDEPLDCFRVGWGAGRALANAMTGIAGTRLGVGEERVDLHFLFSAAFLTARHHPDGGGQ
jgi:hypothetical protein